MTWAILGFAAATIGALTTLALLMHGAHKGKEDAVARAAAERVQRVQTQDELRLANLTLQVKDEEIVILKQRLAAAEQQRNQSMEQARDYLVQRLQSAGIADAAKFGADLLALDFRSDAWVQPPKRLSDDPKDGLIDPTK